MPQLLCNAPCKTCSATDKNHCFSCFSTGKTLLEGTTCVTTCSVGKSPHGGNVCLDCGATCKTCSTTNRFECLTCDQTGIFKYFHSTGKLCYQTCPATTILQGFDCIDCVSPCATCTGTTSTCTTCLGSIVNRYFYQGNC